MKIRVDGVYKIFGRHPERARELILQGSSKDEILQKTGQAVGVANASFEVYEGETLVIMGLSGSGKSTLVRCMNRLMEPTYGSIRIDGEEITGLKPDELRELRRRKFGMVFQSFALFPHKTVLENAEFGLEVQGVPIEVRRPKAQAALDLVGLAGWEDYYPENLSGGMKQRVGLARAMAIEPDILLMDEAFSALDPLIRADMQNELLSLQSQVRKTILFITHDLDEAIKMGDRIVLMKDGRVVQIGTPEEILSNPASPYVARFVENVDRSRVLTAADVMANARSVAFVKDGPRVALKTMTEAGHSGIYVVRKDYELVGYMTAEQAAEAVKRGDTWLEHIHNLDEVPTTDLDTPVRDLYAALSDKGWPIAVVNNKNKLKGVIVRGMVFAALAERGNIG